MLELTGKSFELAVTNVQGPKGKEVHNNRECQCRNRKDKKIIK